jgi:hypothetical protein
MEEGSDELTLSSTFLRAVSTTPRCVDVQHRQAVVLVAKPALVNCGWQEGTSPRPNSSSAL